MIAVKIGALATRMPGQRRGDVVLADRDEQERPGDLDERDEPSQPRCRRAARERAAAQRDRREHQRAERVRAKTMNVSDSPPSSAILMNMYDAPHSAARTTIRIQARRVISLTCRTAVGTRTTTIRAGRQTLACTTSARGA